MKARIIPPFGNHRNIALQFSGGKDSLAAAYLLRPYWDRMTLYHVDTGDLLPEMLDVVKSTEKMVPNFVRIDTNSVDWTRRNGLPSDLVPTNCTPFGNLFGLSDVRLVDRFACCASNIMGPMHHRMIADGITLAIRGTKKSDQKRIPAFSGDKSLGYELWLPIQEWSQDDVFAYLKEVGAPICRVYEHRVNAPECATCPAWWSEGRAEYLARYHPALLAEYKRKLSIISAEVMPLVEQMRTENG